MTKAGLRPCEKKWCISDLECLRLLTGIREYHVYLAAAPFVAPFAPCKSQILTIFESERP